MLYQLSYGGGSALNHSRARFDSVASLAGANVHPGRPPLGVEIVVASSRWRRLIGLALRPPPAPPGRALLLPRCRSIHTCGMRYPLDLVWLDGAGAVLEVEQGVRPWRLRSHAGAAALIEAPAGQGAAAARAWQRAPELP